MYLTRYIIIRSVLCFVTASLAVIHLLGQTTHQLTEYTTENGLSLNSVNDLYFDSQGFLWVTTADGLQRFDGYKFKTFKHDVRDKKSITENSVSEVYEDTNGNLWITCRTGICFKQKGKFEFIDLSRTLGKPQSYPQLPVFETDSAVHILYFPLGVYAINKYSLQVKKIYSFEELFNGERITTLSRFRKKSDNVWCRKGADKTGDLFRFSDTGILRFPNINKIIVCYLLPAAKDSLVVITDKMMYKALANDPFVPISISSFPQPDFDYEFFAMPRKIANDQYLLKGMENIWLLNWRNETLEVLPQEQYFSNEFKNYFNTATSDPHQNSWIGFNGIGGIKVISLRKFNLFERPFKNSLTYTLAGDDKGNVFAGIYLGDIEMYDRAGHFIKKINLPAKHKKAGSPRAMVMIDSVTMIAKSTLPELYAIDIKKGKVNPVSHLLPQRDSSFRIFELGIQRIKDNEVWLSDKNIIFSISKSKSGFTSKPICTIPPAELITSFYYNEAGQLWIGTLTGAWLFEKNELKKVNLPNTYVKHINQHKDGSIWLATTYGLYILKNKLVSRHLNIEDGLPNSFIYSILFDDAGNGWISTNRGLTKISTQYSNKDTSFIITNYSSREGLQGEEFNTKGYYKGTDGSLYFAGVNGINFFNPNKVVNKSEPSKTMLTEIEVNNQPYLPHLQPEFINTISLPYTQNNLRLSFSCMDFTVPEKNQYKFWLKGFQDDWSLPQINNTVQYILPVGEYELHVLGSNYEGVWGKEPLRLKINILPPWYQTNWAKVLFALIALFTVAALFFFISRSRYQKKLRQLQMEQDVQREKQRLSRDLHDNLGSQITWLSNNISQIERAELENKPVEKKLSQLKEGAGELMQTLRETIWILNKDKISCIDLFDKIVSLAARQIEAYPPMQLQTEENIQTTIELNSGQALQIFRICQEVINNVFKHSRATTLCIKADSSTHHFTISVSDNGKGFDLTNKNPEGHYGLQNMKERAMESNLELNIGSLPGKGTTISIST